MAATRICDQVIAGAHDGAQRPGLVGVRGCGSQPVLRSRRYPAMTAASPASDLAPDSTSPSRQVLIAFGLTGTTGCPASSSRSTSRAVRPLDRDRQVRRVAVPGQAADQRRDPPGGVGDVNWAVIFPAASSTHTA